MERLRTIALSYCTAGVLGALAIVLHVRWYSVDKAAGAEVVSGFGAALVVLGVFVGSRPYIRTGIRQLIAASLPQYDGAPFSTDARWQEHKALVERERPQVTRDVWAERVGAVAVVMIGTLFNGYGPLIARLFHLRGS